MSTGVTREDILEELMRRLQQAGMGFKNGFRTLLHWDDPRIAGAELQPAFCLIPDGDEYMATIRGTPRKLMMKYMMWMYAISTDSQVAGDTLLNNLITNVETIALAPDFGNMAGMEPVCTLKLGGTGKSLVNRCWIEGKVIKDPGYSDNQAMAKIPINILVP